MLGVWSYRDTESRRWTMLNRQLKLESHQRRRWTDEEEEGWRAEVRGRQMPRQRHKRFPLKYEVTSIGRAFGTRCQCVDSFRYPPQNNICCPGDDVVQKIAREGDVVRSLVHQSSASHYCVRLKAVHLLHFLRVRRMLALDIVAFSASIP